MNLDCVIRIGKVWRFRKRQILLLYHQGWSGNGRERNRFFGTGHYTGHQEDCSMTELSALEDVVRVMGNNRQWFDSQINDSLRFVI